MGGEANDVCISKSYKAFFMDRLFLFAIQSPREARRSTQICYLHPNIP